MTAIAAMPASKLAMHRRRKRVNSVGLALAFGDVLVLLALALAIAVMTTAWWTYRKAQRGGQSNSAGLASVTSAMVFTSTHSAAWGILVALGVGLVTGLVTGPVTVPGTRRTRSPPGRQDRPSSPHHFGRRRRAEHPGRAADGPLRPALGRSD